MASGLVAPQGDWPFAPFQSTPHREIDAMKGIAAAYKARNLHDFEKVRDEYKDGLHHNAEH